MEHVSSGVVVLFALTTLLTVFLFYKATRKSRTFLLLMAAWMTVLAIGGISGFYAEWEARPPRFVFLPGPALLLIGILFLLPAGRRFIDSLQLSTLTLLHTIRVPVEITLYLLLLAKSIPAIMTFEGWNFDILSGISAPVIFYFFFVRKRMSRTGLLVWNIICLSLLFTIVTIAVLSAPTPFQQLAFDQPNIAVAYFPFVWLPGVVVPLVLLSHLAAIRQLLHPSA